MKVDILILTPSDSEVALLIKHVGISPIQYRRVADAPALRAALREPFWGCLLYCQGDLPLSVALKIVRERECDLPFIVISPPSESAAHAKRVGVHDVIDLDRLHRLAPTIEREMREARHRADHRAALEMLKESEARFRALVDTHLADLTHTQDIEEALRSSREQLAELSVHAETVREEERERIARDIHDEQGSILVRLKIEISLLIAKLPETLPLLREKALSIEKLLDQAMTTTSRIARELRPGILKEFGLVAAIESLAEDFNQRCQFVCRVQCDHDLDPDADTSLALFRIVQEALTNVAKHAGASLVFIRMKRLEEGTITLELRDNGCGISDLDQVKPKSFGLRGIRERVRSLSGAFSVTAAEQGGTCIWLKLPEKRDVEPVATEENTQRTLF